MGCMSFIITANGERMKCWRLRSCESITRYCINYEPQNYANHLNANISYAVLGGRCLFKQLKINII